MDWHITHSFCDWWTMPWLLEIAVKTELRFLSKDRITAFYHPPRSQDVYNNLKNLVNIKEVPNISPMFSTLGGFYSRYGEVAHNFEVNCPNIASLDCDVFLVHDIECVWDDDFDVAVMDQTPYQKKRSKEHDFIVGWEKMFQKFGKKPRPYMSTGILFGKDNVLKEVKDEWISLMGEDLPKLTGAYCKNEYAFSMCMHDKKIKYLDSSVVQDFPTRQTPFPRRLEDFEAEPKPLMWHLGIHGLGVVL